MQAKPKIELKPPNTTCWPHAPIHSLAHGGIFFVTCATYKKEHHFKCAKRLDVLHRGLLSVANEFEWQLEAWAVFSNHYHFVARSPIHEENAETLPIMLGKLHTKTAQWINRLDNQKGRQVWHNYRETRLTIRSSYLARLNYVHQNPVKHRLAANAAMYPWCSAGWFERTANQAQTNKIYGMKIDRLNVPDDFDPMVEL